MTRDERQKVIRAMADEELVGEIAFGNEEALAALYRRHAGWLSGRIWTATASRELAEEVLQDTFLGVWRSAASFRGEGEVGAWLWGIARRRLVSAGAPRATPHRHSTRMGQWTRDRSHRRSLVGGRVDGRGRSAPSSGCGAPHRPADRCRGGPLRRHVGLPRSAGGSGGARHGEEPTVPGPGSVARGNG